MTGARCPGGMAELLLSHAGGNHHPLSHQGSRPLLDWGPGCLCTAHHPTLQHVCKGVSRLDELRWEDIVEVRGPRCMGWGLRLNIKEKVR